MSEFMDIDGPEFIADVNSQIASFRATSVDNNFNDHVYSQYMDDIAMSEEIPPENFNEIAIIDTNFLLSKLGFLDVLLEVAEENPGSLLIILPWIVIKELDGLKKGNRDVSVSARKAIKFLELKLRNNIIALKGQKKDDIHEKSMLNSHSVQNDDRILDCCMFFSQISKKQVSLLSNDRNLSIKAMVHGIESVSGEHKEKMESILNRAARPGSHILAKHISSKTHTIKPTKLKSNHHVGPSYSKISEDYGMDIDESNPKESKGAECLEEDFDMMIDDDFVQEAPSIEKLKDGPEKSKWANAPSGSHSSRSFVIDYEPPVYLNNDPTLTAPKRPFRPEHVSYDWAVSYDIERGLVSTRKEIDTAVNRRRSYTLYRYC